MVKSVFLTAALAATSHAFQLPASTHASDRLVPRSTSLDSERAQTADADATDAADVRIRSLGSHLTRSLAPTLAAASIALGPLACGAVSGGGMDYANLNLTGQDFANGNYKGKDFTQIIAKGTIFSKSNLQGCRFYKAYLVNADFSGADARGAAFEDTSMDGANLRNIVASGSYFGQSLLDVESLEGGDFTDAQIPPKTLKLVCDREDVKGTNPTTGADTRDSLMCL